MTTLSPMNQNARWLVASDLAYQHVQHVCAHQLPEDSLLAERIQSRQVDTVALDELGLALEQAWFRRAKPVLLVVDGIDANLLKVLHALPANKVEATDLRLIDWRSDPVGTVDLMNTEFEEDAQALTDTSETPSWNYFPARLMVAGTTPAPDVGVQLEIEFTPPGYRVPTKARLMLSHTIGAETSALDVNLLAEDVPTLEGCRVGIKIGEEVLDLGRFDDEGWAGKDFDKRIRLVEPFGLVFDWQD